MMRARAQTRRFLKPRQARQLQAPVRRRGRRPRREGRHRPADAKWLAQPAPGRTCAARRPVAWLWVVGRGALIFPPEHPPRRPAHAPCEVDVTKERWWAGARRLTARA